MKKLEKAEETQPDKRDPYNTIDVLEPPQPEVPDHASVATSVIDRISVHPEQREEGEAALAEGQGDQNDDALSQVPS